jgi:hypothetical protein
VTRRSSLGFKGRRLGFRDQELGVMCWGFGGLGFGVRDSGI